jgi:restriction system protein
MGIPDYQTLMLPVLQLAAKGEVTNKACVDSIADQFALTPEEREQLLSSGKQTIIANRVHWAGTYMTKAGLIERPRRGTLTATDRGRAVLRQNPPSIDNKFLAQFQEFQEFKGRSKEKGKSEALDPLTTSHASETVATPEEQIEIAAQEMHSALRDELLSRIGSAEPAFFERLIVDLMLAMGYGASGSGQHLGKTHDGGIDGIINEDPLGLDVVFLQAKRYAPENKIGVEKIREFAGSLDERGAVKGVFVTTSSFAQGARNYAERSPKRLILIDGEELTRLLVRYSVAVRTFRTVELKKIDADYFNAEE